MSHTDCFATFSETSRTKAYRFLQGILAGGVLETLQLAVTQWQVRAKPPKCPCWVVSSRDKLFLLKKPHCCRICRVPGACQTFRGVRPQGRAQLMGAQGSGSTSPARLRFLCVSHCSLWAKSWGDENLSPWRHTSSLQNVSAWEFIDHLKKKEKTRLGFLPASVVELGRQTFVDGSRVLQSGPSPRDGGDPWQPSGVSPSLWGGCCDLPHAPLGGAGQAGRKSRDMSHLGE